MSRSSDNDREPRVPAALEQHLAAALKAAGWSLRPGVESVQFWIAKGAKRYPVLFRLACHGRSRSPAKLDSRCPQRQRDCWDRTVEFTVPKDLKALVQEVIDQAGWAPGQAVTILLDNVATDADGPDYRSSRSVTGVDPARGAEFAPRLVVEFTPP